MDGNLSKALWIGVSLLLFIAVVTIGISIFSGMRDASALANEKIGSIAQGMAEEEFRPYDGKEVSGSQVISAISSFSNRSGEVIIFVATMGNNGGEVVSLDPTNFSASKDFTKYISDTQGKLSSDGYSITLSADSTKDQLLKSISKTIRDAQRRDAENPNLTTKYINPSSKFASQLIYDENMVIRGIVFAQQQ
ncbi:MAG: hypothetical protein GX957_13075 [Clostridiaceae bacterium]|nr:hypothetical protein [Clostridiaceae bacterium]